MFLSGICAVVPLRAHPITPGGIVGSPKKYGRSFSPGPKRHPILARPNDKSGMTLKPCTSAQLQRDLKTRNILDTTKNSSTSCVFIIRLLK